MCLRSGVIAAHDRWHKHPVDPPLNAQNELLSRHVEAHPDFLLIAFRAGALEPLVATRPGQRTVAADEVAGAAEVAPVQGELDEFAHLNAENWLGGRRHAASFGARARRGNGILFRLRV